MRGSLFSSEFPRGGSISSVAFSGVDRTNNISRDNEDVMDNYMVSQDDVSALIMDEQEPSLSDLTFENKIRLQLDHFKERIRTLSFP